MPPLVRFPEGPITPHGAYHIVRDRIPQMGLRSYDDTVVFNLMGGLAIPDRQRPGRVEITGLKGLVPPWKFIDQKGATEDGVTNVETLYEPTDIQVEVRVKGKNPADCRRVGRYLQDSLDAKQQSELWFFTHHLGLWWSKVRWGTAPLDDITNITTKTQKMSLRLRGDHAFWQSFPSVAVFNYNYVSANDSFTTDDPDDLGTGWTVALSGGGSGGVHVEGGEILPDMSGDRTMVARKVGYTSTGYSQVAEIEIGTCGTWFFPVDAADDIWLWMNNSGTPGTSGVRLRIFRHLMRVSVFSGGVETVLRERALVVPPLPGEKFRIFVDDVDPYRFTVTRGGAPLWSFKATGVTFPIGSSNKSIGIGMHSTTAARPASIRGFAGGENAHDLDGTHVETGFLERFNVGDQDMYDNYTVTGPGIFRFWNGPNASANEYVEFGPIVAGQTMQLRTNPSKRGVTDMTATQPSPQQLTQFQKALNDFLSFLTGSNTSPLIREIESKFGILAPQGNPYSLLKGRWSRRAAIPPKSPGKVAQPYHVKVAIVGGNADSQILATGTPLRRMPY